MHAREQHKPTSGAGTVDPRTAETRATQAWTTKPWTSKPWTSKPWTSMPWATTPGAAAEVQAAGVQAANVWAANVWAALAIAVLVVAGAAGVLAQAHLYADGANYLLKLIEAGDFVHIAENRLFATALNQAPVVIALVHYGASLENASFVYGLTLFGIPVLAYGYSLWLTRQEPLAFALTVAVAAIIFLSTVFVIIGEFHVYYSLTWLYAVIISASERRNGLQQSLLLAAAFVTIRSYEAAAVTAPILMLMTLLPFRRPGRVTDKAFLLLLMLLLAASTFVGVKGYLFPRDPENASGFVDSLLKLVENGDLFLPLAAVLASAAAVFIGNAPLRWLAVAGIAAGATAVVWGEEISGYSDVLIMGSPNTQRAQVLPFFLICLGLLSLNRQFGWGQRLQRHASSLAPLLLPLLLGAAIYAVDVQRWRYFIALSCIELERPAGDAYYNHPVVKTFGWDWEMPTLAILLRPPGSTAMLRYPGYAGWYPFDPDTEQPDIDAVKHGAGICLQ